MIRPPCSRTICRLMESPSPVPAGLVVKNGSKILSIDLLGDPAAGVAEGDLDGQARAIAPDRAGHPELPSPVHRLDGVEHDVQEDLLDGVPVDGNRAGSAPGRA